MKGSGEEPGRLVSLALWPTLVGGLILAVDWTGQVPKWVSVLGWLAFSGGCVAAGFAAYFDARRSGGGILGSLWAGVKRFFRWLAAFFP